MPTKRRAPRLAWVATDGNDEAAGSREAPFATIARALASRAETVHLMPGRHDEPQVLLTRAVRLRGPENGRALVAGHLFVSADDTDLRRVDLGGGLAAHGVRGLRVRDGRLTAGDRDETVLLTRTHAVFEDLEITPGVETGIHAVDADISISRVEIRPRRETERGIQLDTSRLDADRLTTRAGKTAHVQIADRSVARLSNLVVGGSTGTGLMVLSSSTISVDRARFERGLRFGLLVQESHVRMKTTELAGAEEVTVGVQGGGLLATTSTVGASPEGGLVLSALRNAPAYTQLIRCTVRHGAYDGARVSGGRLVARKTRFIGLPDASAPRPESARPGNTVLVHGVTSHAELLGVHLDSPAGHGVLVTEDATAFISGRIENPGQGGLQVEGVRVTPVRIENLRIEGCRAGSGVTAIDSVVIAENLTVRRCPEAGVLAGARSAVRVRQARVSGKGRYGFAAFGGSTLTLEAVRATGLSWAAFTSCADGARLVQKEKNRLEGPVVTCP